MTRRGHVRALKSVYAAFSRLTQRADSPMLSNTYTYICTTSTDALSIRFFSLKFVFVFIYFEHPLANRMRPCVTRTRPDGAVSQVHAGLCGTRVMQSEYHFFLTAVDTLSGVLRADNGDEKTNKTKTKRYKRYETRRSSTKVRGVRE